MFLGLKTNTRYITATLNTSLIRDISHDNYIMTQTKKEALAQSALQQIAYTDIAGLKNLYEMGHTTNNISHHLINIQLSHTHMNGTLTSMGLGPPH